MDHSSILLLHSMHTASPIISVQFLSELRKWYGTVIHEVCVPLSSLLFLLS